MTLIKVIELKVHKVEVFLVVITSTLLHHLRNKGATDFFISAFG